MLPAAPAAGVEMVMVSVWEVPAAAVAVAERLHKLPRATLAELRLTLRVSAVGVATADRAALRVMGGRADKQRQMRKEVTTQGRLA